MKKGFTLVELLAVITILGLLAVIIVPKVTKTIKDSEQKTNMASANGLLKAAEYRYQDNEIKGTTEEVIINYETRENIDKLDYNGRPPEKGKLIITKDGKIVMAVKIGDSCYTKKLTSNDIEIAPYNEETCENNGKLFISYNIPETTTSGDGLYESTTEPGRLIYRGSNPNNYINIKEDGTNDTLYRIVSYETDGTIKVVRNERIGDRVWDTKNIRIGDSNTYCSSAVDYGCNVWGNQTNTLYNGSPLGDNFHYIYYVSADATTLTNGVSGKVEAESTLNQFLNSKILNSENSWQPAIQLDNYIDNHSWNVGGVYYTSDDKGIEKEKEEERQLTWNGKVGLLNVTEYVEASTNPNCTSVRINYGRECGSPCKINNWTMYNKSYTQWTISAFLNYKHIVWNVHMDGFFSNFGKAYLTSGVRPVFYLKSSIELGGNGTESDPYYIIN